MYHPGKCHTDREGQHFQKRVMIALHSEICSDEQNGLFCFCVTEASEPEYICIVLGFPFSALDKIAVLIVDEVHERDLYTESKRGSGIWRRGGQNACQTSIFFEHIRLYPILKKHQLIVC